MTQKYFILWTQDQKLIIFIKQIIQIFFFLMSYKVFLGLHNYHDQNGVQHVNVPGRNAFPMKGYDPVNIKNDMMLLKVCIYI